MKEMKSMGPCFRPGWARLGVGSCHFICSADNIAVPGRCCVKMIFKTSSLFGSIWYNLESSNAVVA